MEESVKVWTVCWKHSQAYELGSGSVKVWGVAAGFCVLDAWSLEESWANKNPSRTYL